MFCMKNGREVKGNLSWHMNHLLRKCLKSRSRTMCKTPATVPFQLLTLPPSRTYKNQKRLDGESFSTYPDASVSAGRPPPLLLHSAFGGRRTTTCFNRSRTSILSFFAVEYIYLNQTNHGVLCTYLPNSEPQRSDEWSRRKRDRRPRTDGSCEEKWGWSPATRCR